MEACSRTRAPTFFARTRPQVLLNHSLMLLQARSTWDRRRETADDGAGEGAQSEDEPNRLGLLLRQQRRLHRAYRSLSLGNSGPATQQVFLSLLCDAFRPKRVAEERVGLLI